MFKISYCSFTFKLKEKKKVPLEWVGNISKKGGLIKRGKEEREEGGLWPSKKYGGTTNRIFILSQLLEKYQARKEDFYVSFVDLEKTFYQVLMFFDGLQRN